jgi:hypothetical protein
MKKENFKVDFIGIGAPKCGTSWVAKWLEEHPDVCMAQPKDNGYWHSKKYPNPNMKEYKKFFPKPKKGQIRGDFTAGYFHQEEIPRLFKNNFPKTKFILILRNPTNRIYSGYLWYLKNNFKSIPFQKYLKKQNRTNIGFYYKHLNNWLKHFQKKQIKILYYEEVKRNPKKYAKELFAFLGIDKKFVPPSLSKKINPGGLPKNNFIKLIIISLRKVYVKLFKNNRRKADKTLKKLKLLKLYKSIKKKNQDAKSDKYLKEKDKKYLKELYKKDMKKLNGVVEKDLKKLWGF